MKIQREDVLKFSKRQLKSVSGRLAFGFTMVEVASALVVLTIIVSSVLLVMNRAMDSCIDLKNRGDALKTARENMEKILARDSVRDTSQYGISESNPAISWENVIETFYEPVTSEMWIRAVCKASYLDTNNEEQSVTLTNWLTGLDRNQVQQILRQQQQELELIQELGRNPFGNDAEGLLQYAEVLNKGGDIYGALEVIDELIYRYPESLQALEAEAIEAKLERQVEEYENSGSWVGGAGGFPGSGSTGGTGIGFDGGGGAGNGGGAGSGEGSGGTGEQSPGNGSNNPYGLPSGWEEWPIEDILSALREKGVI